MDVVICEDDSGAAWHLEQPLRKGGHSVSGIFPRLSEVVARCRHMPPDLVVMRSATADAPGGPAYIQMIAACEVTVWIVEDDF